MRTKRIYIILTVLGLLGALTTTVYATSSRHAAAPSIVGVWQVTIKIEAMPESFEGLYTFFADGNFLDTNSFKETNPGVWIGAGNTYVVTFWGFLFDEQGQVNGKARVRASIKMDDTDHFTAQGVTRHVRPSRQGNGKPVRWLLWIHRHPDRGGAAITCRYTEKEV